MRIGEKIQRIRKERGYTAEQLAEMLEKIRVTWEELDD